MTKTTHDRVMALPAWLRKELSYLAHMQPSQLTLEHNVAVSGERVLSIIEQSIGEDDPLIDGDYTANAIRMVRNEMRARIRTGMPQLNPRIGLAEDIIRAHYELEQAMYDSDLEVSWQNQAKKVNDLEHAYVDQYGEFLGGN